MFPGKHSSASATGRSEAEDFCARNENKGLTERVFKKEQSHY